MRMRNRGAVRERLAICVRRSEINGTLHPPARWPGTLHQKDIEWQNHPTCGRLGLEPVLPFLYRLFR
jgi:hypothetical protein